MSKFILLYDNKVNINNDQLQNVTMITHLPQ